MTKKKNIKNAKKENKNENKKENKKEKISIEEPSEKNEMGKLLKIVLIVTGIMIVFYGVTLIATNKSDEIIEKNKEEAEKTEATIQYENIMIGSMLNYSGTYYVLIEDADDNRLTEYDSIITTIQSNEDAPNIYKANLTDSFNKTYLGKEQNYYTDDLGAFKVTGTVLVKVVDGKIKNVDDSHEAIKNTLDSLE